VLVLKRAFRPKYSAAVYVLYSYRHSYSHSVPNRWSDSDLLSSTADSVLVSQAVDVDVQLLLQRMVWVADHSDVPVKAGFSLLEMPVVSLSEYWNHHCLSFRVDSVYSFVDS
jgi:hypothetical protein